MMFTSPIKRIISIYLFSFVLLFVPSIYGQNIGVNEDGASPDASAILDIKAEKKGVLIPRVTLQSTTDVVTITNPSNSLLVYNTNSSMTGGNEGYYYWDENMGSNGEWVSLSSDNNAWKMDGNDNTTMGTHFLGTTTAEGVDFRTNNTIRFRIPNAYQMHAMNGGIASAPFYSWSSNPTSGMFLPSSNVLGFSTNGIERFRIPNGYQVFAMSNGTASAPFYSWSADANMGIFRAGVDILGFSTNGVERMRINATGNVGVGTTAPHTSAVLEVSATNKGVVIPNVALTAANVASPVTSPKTSLKVYNTATSGTGVNQVHPGFYYWDGSIWKREVDNNLRLWVTATTDINANTTYNFTVNIPGHQSYDAAFVNLAGDWSVAPDIFVTYVESRTGQVRFRVTNETGGLFGGGTNYLGMDFIITTIKP